MAIAKRRSSQPATPGGLRDSPDLCLGSPQGRVRRQEGQLRAPPPRTAGGGKEYRQASSPPPRGKGAHRHLRQNARARTAGAGAQQPAPPAPPQGERRRAGTKSREAGHERRAYMHLAILRTTAGARMEVPEVAEGGSAPPRGPRCWGRRIVRRDLASRPPPPRPSPVTSSTAPASLKGGARRVSRRPHIASRRDVGRQAADDEFAVPSPPHLIVAYKNPLFTQEVFASVTFVAFHEPPHNLHAVF